MVTVPGFLLVARRASVSIDAGDFIQGNRARVAPTTVAHARFRLRNKPLLQAPHDVNHMKVA